VDDQSEDQSSSHKSLDISTEEIKEQQKSGIQQVSDKPASLKPQPVFPDVKLFTAIKSLRKLPPFGKGTGTPFEYPTA
jgi:hypothetical protein